MLNHFRLPLLVVFWLLGINLTTSQTTILDQSLLTAASFNTFTPVSVTGAQNWTFSSTYGAVCSGYSAGQNYENEDWFVSPAMNLTDVANVKLTFSHTRGSSPFVNVGVAEGWYKVFATANFTGDPSSTQWIELTGVNQSIPTGWQFVSSGDLIVPEVAKSATSRIAFRYISSATQSSTWELKYVKVTGEVPTNPDMAVFKITNWNTEWLGCTSFGPTDETLQLTNVAAAMQAMDADIYCIQEVSNTATYPSISSLVGLLGSDVWDGSLVPSTTGDCEQRQGIIYKKARVQVVATGQLNNGSAAQGNSYFYNWSGGRYPAVYNVTLLAGSTTVPLTIVNIHGKSEDGDAMSYTRRLGGSQALKTLLDGSNYNTKNLLLVGDFNDYLVGTSSTACVCTDSPYKNFMDDTADYTGLTQYLNDAHWNHPLIENMIVSNELVGNYVSNSAAQEVTVPPSISNYYNTTSDHLPVSARFQFSTLGAPQFSYTGGNVLQVYPNPVTQVLQFDATGIENGSAIAIYDLTGRQVYADKVNGNTIVVSALPAGIYLLKAGARIGRFVKE